MLPRWQELPNSVSFTSGGSSDVQVRTLKETVFVSYVKWLQHQCGRDAYEIILKHFLKSNEVLDMKRKHRCDSFPALFLPSSPPSFPCRSVPTHFQVEDECRDQEEKSRRLFQTYVWPCTHQWEWVLFFFECFWYDGWKGQRRRWRRAGRWKQWDGVCCSEMWQKWDRP